MVREIYDDFLTFLIPNFVRKTDTLKNQKGVPLQKNSIK
jgi:hypothetical protein